VAQTASALVGSICRQLMTYTVAVPAALRAAFRKSRYGRSPPTLEELVKLLVSVIDLFSSVYIVIDAIDELDGGSSTTKRLLIQSLACLNKSSKHIFITSRSHSSGIEEAFANILHLDIKTDDGDVRRLVLYTPTSGYPATYKEVVI
jgi:ankyrin repeat domain-containing protein 50